MGRPIRRLNGKGTRREVFDKAKGLFDGLNSIFALWLDDPKIPRTTEEEKRKKSQVEPIGIFLSELERRKRSSKGRYQESGNKPSRCTKTEETKNNDTTASLLEKDYKMNMSSSSRNDEYEGVHLRLLFLCWSVGQGKKIKEETGLGSKPG